MKGILEARGPGRWRLRVSTGEQGGKRRFLSEAFRGSKRQALTRLAELVAQAGRRRGVHVDGRMTVGDYLAGWVEARAARGKGAASTRATAARHVRLHLSPELGHLRLRDLGHQHLERFYRDKAREGLAASTVRQLHATVSSALADAVRARLLADNPAARAERPALERRPPRLPTAEQLAAALAQAPDRVRAAILLMVASGLRRAEVCPLVWDQDVDLDHGVVHVRRQFVRVGPELLTVTPKTAAGSRVVVLPAAAIAWLEGYRIRQRVARMRDGVRPAEDFVFHDRQGRPWRPDGLSESVKYWARRAGADFTAHGLRHYSLTALLVGGVPVRVAQAIAGHSSPTITASIYQHVIAELEQRAAGVADASLGIILGSNSVKQG